MNILIRETKKVLLTALNTLHFFRGQLILFINFPSEIMKQNKKNLEGHVIEN